MTVKLVISVIIAYLLGDINPAIMLSRLKGSDIRGHGSGNAGTTNMLRVYGKKSAALTLAVDVLKGVLAVLIGRFLCGETGASACVLAVIAGHVWPVFYGFKGGKGIAASLGALLTLSPAIAGLALLVFIAVVLATRMVSAASICAALSLPVISAVLKSPFLWWSLVIAAILVFKHRSNIKRIIAGEESKLDFSKYKK